jgi:hypothetical protein
MQAFYPRLTNFYLQFWQENCKFIILKKIVENRVRFLDVEAPRECLVIN